MTRGGLLLRSTPHEALHALRRLRQREATHTGFASPGCAAPSGFLSLLALHSSRSPSGFVSRRKRPWASPFRGLLLSRGRVDLSADLPLVVLPAASSHHRAVPADTRTSHARPERQGGNETIQARRASENRWTSHRPTASEHTARHVAARDGPRETPDEPPTRRHQPRIAMSHADGRGDLCQRTSR
jgi:hypothetical protein